MTTDSLHPLTQWFMNHCDGDWEHDLGIRVQTLDNPGWALDVRIEDTELEGRTADWSRRDDDSGWLHWRSTGVMFEARCGPSELGAAIEAFILFASSSSDAR